MTTVAIIIGTLIVLIILLSLLRLRVRFELSADRRRVFAGLGRTGWRADFVRGDQAIQIMGITVKRMPLAFEKTAEKKPPEVKPEAEKPTKPSPPLTERLRSIGASPWELVSETLPQMIRSIQAYFFELLGSVIVEELEAEIEGGFESPDLTGMAFGYYQAALAAAPALVGRLHYTPYWEGGAWSGSARGSVALPLYRLSFRTISLLWRLPLRRIIKLAIGMRKGASDGQQRS